MIIKFPDTSERAKDPPSQEASSNHIYPWPWEVLDGLPFVDPAPPPKANGWVRLNRNCWNDKPTESGVHDYARGRRYAKMMLSAMRRNSDAHGNSKLGNAVSARALDEIFQSMIRDAIARQKKGGEGSRTIVTSAMSGFLVEVTGYVAGVRG